MSSLVKYHNNFVEAIYKIDVLCKKLLIGISHKVQKCGKYGTPVIFNASEVCDIVGIQKGSYRYLEKCVEQLMSTVITIREPDTNNWVKFNMIGRSEYKDGKLIVLIPNDMKPFLSELKKRFTTYHIENIKPLKSTYSIKIYELLAQYRNSKHKYRAIDLDELRKLLGCEKKYSRFDSFKSRVLEPAKHELKANCDLYFDYEVKKYGRKISGIIFSIYHQELNIDVIDTMTNKEKEEYLRDQYKEIKEARTQSMVKNPTDKILKGFSEEHKDDGMAFEEDGAPKDILLYYYIQKNWLVFPSFDDWKSDIK
jgi:plasmid replication initiation protein